MPSMVPCPRSLILAVFPVIFTLHRLFRRASRLSKIPASAERVLILGASSGVGRSVARIYAKRGARVCVVGRRAEKIDEVVKECREICLTRSRIGGHTNIVGVVADFSDVDDMVRVRGKLETEWGGVDTIVVAAGVSALLPLMAVAGVGDTREGPTLTQATRDGIQHTVEVTNLATKSNYIGPLVAAVTFIPLLQNSSPSPSILLVNTLASVIPAPTRAIYASTKSASLLLYQALAIEHPSIKFTFFLPATIEGDFRAGAVDGGIVREADPQKTGLRREDVAKRLVRSVDWGEKTVFMPEIMRLGHLLYWIVPKFIEWRARVKYNFTA